MHCKAQLSIHASHASQTYHAVHANHDIHANSLAHAIMLHVISLVVFLTPHTLGYLMYMLT